MPVRLRPLLRALHALLQAVDDHRQLRHTPQHSPQVAPVRLGQVGQANGGVPHRFEQGQHAGDRALSRSVRHAEEEAEHLHGRVEAQPNHREQHLLLRGQTEGVPHPDGMRAVGPLPASALGRPVRLPQVTRPARRTLPASARSWR